MVKELFKIEIEMEQKMCESCILKDDNFFIMKIQIRYPLEIDEMYRKDLEEKINKIFIWYKDIINNVKEKSNKNNKEIDIFFRKNISYNKIYYLLSKNYLVYFKKSNKLVGFDKEISKKKYKNTFLFEISNIRSGDIILFKGEKYKVKSIFKNNIILINLENSKKLNITYSINKDLIRKL